MSNPEKEYALYKGDIIIPVNNEGAMHIIKAPYKNEAVWKYDEEEIDEKY